MSFSISKVVRDTEDLITKNFNLEKRDNISLTTTTTTYTESDF